MRDNIPSQDQVEWNLSSALINEIQALLSISTRLYLAGNIRKAFWSLKAVKFRFIQSLNSEERTLLKDLEKEFFHSINKKEKNKMAYVYDVYTEKIMDFLEMYGYLIPKKKDITRIS